MSPSVLKPLYLVMGLFQSLTVVALGESIYVGEAVSFIVCRHVQQLISKLKCIGNESSPSAFRITQPSCPDSKLRGTTGPPVYSCDSACSSFDKGLSSFTVLPDARVTRL